MWLLNRQHEFGEYSQKPNFFSRFSKLTYVQGSELSVSIKVGIIRTSSIGDVVLATACLDFLRGIVPEENTVWIGRKPTLGLLKLAYPNLRTIQLASRASAQDFATAKAGLADCDVIIDLQNSFLSRRLASSLRTANRSVVTVRKLKFFRLRLVFEAILRNRLIQLPSLRTTVPKYQYQMMLDAIKDALRARGVAGSTEKIRPSLRLPTEDGPENILWRDMNFGAWLAVAPGASHKPKRAPTVIFQDVLSYLPQLLPSNQVPLGLVYVGSSDDRQAANQLIDNLQWNGPVLNLAGKLTLEQSAVVLSKSKILLSNDSGLTHIAEAVGVPVAVLFGPTIESFGFAPWRAESRAHSARIGCRPCSRHGKKPCRFGDQLCFHSIDTRDVARHLAKNLGGEG